MQDATAPDTEERPAKPRSIRNQLQKVLQVISEIERISGSVKDDDFYDTLQSDHGISRPEGAHLMGVLMKDGTIYSPRPGYYKRTNSVGSSGSVSPSETEDPRVKEIAEYIIKSSGKYTTDQLAYWFSGIPRHILAKLLARAEALGVIYLDTRDGRWFKA